jgi:hypothetical protein
MPYPYDFTAQSTGEVIAATDINELQTALEDVQNRVGATALTGTPAAGKVPVATSATAAEWAAVYPTSATIWHDQAKVITGNALLRNLDNNQYFQIYTYQNAAANGDVFEHTVALAAGTYTFEVLGLTANSRGIIDWTLGGVALVTGQDWYSAALTYNVIKSNSVTVATSGVYTLRGTINGKNASSTAYQMLLTKYWFRV